MTDWATIAATISMAVVFLLQSVESWAAYAKLLIGLGVALMIVSGGVFMLAWGVAQKARAQWFGLAKEWAESDNFRIAVNTTRKDLTERLILEMHNEIDRRIGAHNSRENIEAHRAAMKHVFNGEVMGAIGKYGFERQIRELEAKVEKLEKRR